MPIPLAWQRPFSYCTESHLRTKIRFSHGPSLKIMRKIGYEPTGNDVTTVPEPHPLDFDWRFDIPSVNSIAKIVSNSEPVVALGCPSLAKHFREIGIDCILIDRQPLQCVGDQIKLDIQVDPPVRLGFRKAIVDPPWYPDYLYRWLAWAAACLGGNGEIYASIWPSETRPNGEHEYLAARKWMETWSDVTELSYQPTYDVPPFEIASVKSSKNGNLARSPRLGRLIRLNVKRIPLLPEASLEREHWTRFVFNSYQIAVRMSDEAPASPSLEQLPAASGWIWPFVSRRAPERSKIDVWSSRNEVAQISGEGGLIGALQELSAKQSTRELEGLLQRFPSLTDWKIPRPPYWRTMEWLHQQ